MVSHVSSPCDGPVHVFRPWMQYVVPSLDPAPWGKSSWVVRSSSTGIGINPVELLLFFLSYSLADGVRKARLGSELLSKGEVTCQTQQG